MYVTIRETLPEAHTHQQMQSVFIAAICFKHVFSLFL